MSERMSMAAAHGSVALSVREPGLLWDFVSMALARLRLGRYAPISKDRAVHRL